MATCWKIYHTDNAVEIHLQANEDYDVTLCGFDLEGDPEVHRLPPERHTIYHTVTCETCLAIIEGVQEYLD